VMSPCAPFARTRSARSWWSSPRSSAGVKPVLVLGVEPPTSRLSGDHCGFSR
jgi:hypothetical protein